MIRLTLGACVLVAVCLGVELHRAMEAALLVVSGILIWMLVRLIRMGSLIAYERGVLGVSLGVLTVMLMQGLRQAGFYGGTPIDRDPATRANAALLLGYYHVFGKDWYGIELLLFALAIGCLAALAASWARSAGPRGRGP